MAHERAQTNHAIMVTRNCEKKYDFAVVGGGIVGLAHARAAAERGWSVALFERSTAAIGASIRNFGMIWPIGQPVGELHRFANRSREIWLDLAIPARIWVNPCGSIHLARRDDEWAVLEEFHATASETHRTSLLSADQVLAKSPAANAHGLIGGMYSPTELCVDPRQAISQLPSYLRESRGVETYFQTAVNEVDDNMLTTADGRRFSAERIVIASGTDFETLFPEMYRAAGLIRCKLQMLRTAPQADGWRAGPHLAGGLTLRHYKSFESCPSLPRLKQRIADESPELDRFGIHIMAAQNERGEVVLGDSHEYGIETSPFDSSEIESLMLRELMQLICLPDWTIQQRWHGVYAKSPDQPIHIAQPTPRVKIVAGLGGAGMTLSFGLAEHVIDQWA